MEVLRVRMVAVVWIASTSTAANALLVTVAGNARKVSNYNYDKFVQICGLIKFISPTGCLCCFGPAV